MCQRIFVILTLVCFVLPEVHAQTVSTLGPNLDGGTGGVCVDDSGYIYVADFGTCLGQGCSPGDKVFKVSPEGDVSIFAIGLVGASGNTFDASGNLFQSNIAANRISRITPSGQVTTFVTTGISNPVGLVFDDDGNLYVCNCGNNTIQKVTPAGVSTPFAVNTLFNCPNGITRDDDGNFYVANFSNSNVLKISPDGTSVTLFAVIPGGNNGHILFGNGVLYVAGRGANRIYQITLAGQVSVLAGNGVRAIVDGPALQSSFSLPNDIGLDPTGRYLYSNDVVGATSPNSLRPMAVRRIDLGAPTPVHDGKRPIPRVVTLHQNYPNPFNPSTTITYDLPTAAHVTVRIYNQLGRQVRVLVDAQQAPGNKSIVWDATDQAGERVSSGTYVYEVRVGETVQSRRMILLK